MRTHPLVFDDTVIDKRYAIEIEITKRQYSGNEHGVIQGIGLVNCVSRWARKFITMLLRTERSEVKQSQGF